MDKYNELYIARRYVALVFALLAVIGFPATGFFGVPIGTLFFSETGIMILGIVIVSFIWMHRKESRKRELKKGERILIVFFILGTLAQLFNVVLSINLKIFPDMIYLTIAFMAVILNMVSGTPVKTFMSRYVPESAKRRAWMYMIIMILLSNFVTFNQILLSFNLFAIINYSLLIILSLSIFVLVVSGGHSKTRARKRDKTIFALLLLLAALFLLGTYKSGGHGPYYFGDIGGIVIAGLMIFTVFM